MDYPNEIINASAKAFTKELGEISKHIARGIAKGQAIKHNLERMNEKIAAAAKIGITSATPLDKEKIEKLFNYIEPLTAFSFQNNEMRKIICQELADYFSTFAKIEEEFLSEVYYSEKKATK